MAPNGTIAQMTKQCKSSVSRREKMPHSANEFRVNVSGEKNPSQIE